MTSRSTISAGCLCTLMPLFATTAVAQSASDAVRADRAASTAVMSLRLPQPASANPARLRFRGSVTFAAPRKWDRKYSRTDSGDATFSLTLATHCTASGFVHSSVTVSHEDALRQLLAELPHASQPEILQPRSVRTIGQGTINRGTGGWALIAPPAARGAFTFYGGVLLEVERDRWAGVIVGFVASAGCPAALPQRAAVVADLTHMLRTTRLRNVSVTSIA